MTSREIYARVPLKTDKREIRILALVPSTSGDTLHRDLFVKSLDYDTFTTQLYPTLGLVQ